MTWTQHIPASAEKKYQARIDTGVRIGINAFGRDKKTFRTLISVTPEVAQRIFDVRDQQPFPVKVFIGEGENSGKVRIVSCKRMEEGAILASYCKAGKKGWYRISLGNVPSFPSWAQPMKMCQITTEAHDVMVLALPEWEKAPKVERAVDRRPQVGPGTKPMPMAVKPVTTSETPLRPVLPVATSRRELDEAAAKARAAVPAPDFSGVHKPKPTRKELLAKVGDFMKGGG